MSLTEGGLEGFMSSMRHEWFSTGFCLDEVDYPPPKFQVTICVSLNIGDLELLLGKEPENAGASRLEKEKERADQFA